MSTEPVETCDPNNKNARTCHIMHACASVLLEFFQVLLEVGLQIWPTRLVDLVGLMGQIDTI